MTLTVKNWPFLSLRNSLELEVASSVVSGDDDDDDGDDDDDDGDSDDDSDDDDDGGGGRNIPYLCETNAVDDKGNLRWLQVC